MIKMTKTKQVKKEGTKTVWVDEAVEVQDIDQKTHDRIVDAVPWFRNLGGTESLTREYTCAGYVVTRIVSTSPDKQNRSIYEFDFS